MVGAVIIVVVLLVLPVVFFMTGAIVAAILGALVQDDVERQHAGSELVDLNR